MKRFFTFACFLVLTLALHAQMTMEEISYVPSPSGYYNNLIVKGSVRINEMVVNPFTIQSYSSLLRVNVDDDSRLLIKHVSVPHSKGTVIVKESIEDGGSFGGGIVAPVDPPVPAEKSGGKSSKNDATVKDEKEVKEEGGSKATQFYIPFDINGGTLSVSGLDSDSNFYFSIGSISLEKSEPAIFASAQNIESINAVDLKTKDLTIFGMQVPKCPNNYYWQKVKVGSLTYKVLACNTTACSNPEEEEKCYIEHAGEHPPFHWDISKCKCTREQL